MERARICKSCAQWGPLFSSRWQSSAAGERGEQKEGGREMRDEVQRECV